MRVRPGDQLAVEVDVGALVEEGDQVLDLGTFGNGERVAPGDIGGDGLAGSHQHFITHQYLLDGLSALDGPVAVMSFTDPKKPAVIAPAGDDGAIASSYRYLIMPVRIGA